MGSLKYFAVFFLVLQMVSADTAVSSAFKNADLSPYIVPIAPDGKLQVAYGAKQVNLGNQIPLQSTIFQPVVKWDAVDDKYYTLVMIDPDYPSRSNPSLGEFNQWMVVNIPGNNIGDGETLAGYVLPTPAPGTGKHRMTFVVYVQPGYLNFDENPITGNADRFSFSNAQFSNKYQLKSAYGNFYNVESI